jgi:hypothetical protein
VGTITARGTGNGDEVIEVDPTAATMYAETRRFVSKGGKHYTNLVYRIHFEYVPFPHLTTGNNGGLLVILTLNSDNQPVLVTTVHTCGCYLAIVPTSYLDETAYPDDWDADSQRVYGETLPGRLDMPPRLAEHARVRLFLRHATHRIMDVDIIDERTLAATHRVHTMALKPADTLTRLPTGNGNSTSFYYQSERARGYVKNALKPLEFLFMSWWALDLRVGVDKIYGQTNEPGPAFYTSLKPWARAASDMRDFAGFLSYWGWKL